MRALRINNFKPVESIRPVLPDMPPSTVCKYTHAPTHTHIAYLGVDNGAGNLFHVGQVSSLGHQDRFSGQANLDDEGHPCWSGRQWGHQSPTRNLPWYQVHNRKTTLSGHGGHGYGGPLLQNSWAGWRGAPRRKEDLGHGPWGHTRASVSHSESCLLAAWSSQHTHSQTHAQVQSRVLRKPTVIQTVSAEERGVHTLTHGDVHTHTHTLSRESWFLCVLVHPLPVDQGRNPYPGSGGFSSFQPLLPRSLLSAESC